MDHPAPQLDRAPGRLQAHVITAMYSSADDSAITHQRLVMEPTR